MFPRAGIRRHAERTFGYAHRRIAVRKHPTSPARLSGHRKEWPGARSALLGAVYPTSAALAREERSKAEIINGFRTVLDDAVAERLTADVEVACYLSGGLDSSAVLGLAQARLDRPMRAFTIAFEGAFDESPLAQRTAAFTGSNYVPVPVTPQVMADALEDTVWHCERPIFNANVVAKFLLSRAVRDAGIKVVFTGEGSDEMLAGYMFRA